MVDYKNGHDKMSTSLGANNLILFGPPGIGKSTIIRHLAKAGVPAVDLEELGSLPLRNAFIKKHRGYIIGGADVFPKQPIAHSFKCLLYGDQLAYDARRMARDAQQPSKANQSKHSIMTWRSMAEKHFHFSVKITDMDVLEACCEILKRAVRVGIVSQSCADRFRRYYRLDTWEHKYAPKY
jgi:energy-coupling factor transporter ATP-binding protein EcfA2